MILQSKWHGEVLHIAKHQGQDGSTVLECGAGGETTIFLLVVISKVVRYPGNLIDKDSFW